MWDKINKDPLIKTIVVILLGVLAFGFAFHIMFGSGSSSMEDGSMMSSGYSLSNTLGNIIELLIKLVIITLLIGIIVWIFRVITKPLGTEPNHRFLWLKEDPIIKNTLMISGLVLVLLSSFSILRSISTTGTGEEMMNLSSFNSILLTSFRFTSFVSFLLNILILIFVVILGCVFIMYFNENYRKGTDTKDNETLQAEDKDCPDCKAKVKEGWKCCPYCGNDMVV